MCTISINITCRIDILNIQFTALRSLLAVCKWLVRVKMYSYACTHRTIYLYNAGVLSRAPKPLKAWERGRLGYPRRTDAKKNIKTVQCPYCGAFLRAFILRGLCSMVSYTLWAPKRKERGVGVLTCGGRYIYYHTGVSRPAHKNRQICIWLLSVKFFLPCQ